MLVTVCNKVTGRFMVRGENALNTKVARLLSEGHTEVESEPPSKEHVWNGNDWVLNDTLVSAKTVRDNLTVIVSTDADIPRIVEDLINLLEAKGVINLSELPVKAREKLEKRRTLRGA